MCRKHKPVAVLLVLLIFCVLLFPFSGPEGRMDAVHGTAAQTCCIRQSTAPAGSGAHSFFFVEENARISSGTGVFRLLRMKINFFRLEILHSFSLTLSVLLFLWNWLKQRSVFGFDTCLHPPARFLLELTIRRKKDGKKRVSVPVFG